MTLDGERILITGAAGSIGQALREELGGSEDRLYTDRDTMDVTVPWEIAEVFDEFRPTLVFHLAGAKHAPLGEEDPAEAALVNITGTAHVLEAARDVKVVTASTCKACNPETAYGATKLIAERMTLNAGGSVARFYNVRETCGNVFDIWRDIPEDEPIPVTPCFRRFMSIDQAVALLLRAAVLPSGRYTVAGAVSQSMDVVAAECYPGRAQVHVPRRRGDRTEEPELATQEWAEPAEDGIVRILSPHDARVPVPA